jgi:putative membrane protein insertion efficiency factor
LRPALRRPKTWLALIAALALATVADSYRLPGRQVTALIYVGMVRVYQAIGSPVTRRLVQCRYQPTCSQYSIEAVEMNGIREGLLMTARRIARCTPDVPLGTVDAPTSVATASDR